MNRYVTDTFLSRLDKSVRWTGINARVADEMYGTPMVGRKLRPLRWIPMFPIAISCALFLLSLAWPAGRLTSAGVATLAMAPALGGTIVAMVPVISMIGPLGKPSLDDDEREAALRKDSFLFCLGLLACFNCLGQPLLMILAVVQQWHAAHSASVAGSAFMLNATLFMCLPTLYASWKLKQFSTQ